VNWPDVEQSLPFIWRRESRLMILERWLRAAIDNLSSGFGSEGGGEGIIIIEWLWLWMALMEE